MEQSSLDQSYSARRRANLLVISGVSRGPQRAAGVDGGHAGDRVLSFQVR